MESGRAEPGRAERLTLEELAERAHLDVESARPYARRGVLEPDADGRFEPGDVHRLRLLAAFDEAGVPFDALVAAQQGGAITLDYYDQLHEPAAPSSSRTVAQLVASAGAAGDLIGPLFAAFGLAQPDPDARLSVDDETFVLEMANAVAAIGHRDLALRAIRLFAEAARRASDGALGVYADAVERLGEHVEALPAEEAFERLLSPWARIARAGPRLAGWLTTHHLSRAIDEYSVTTTEEVLERSGYIAERSGPPPAIAFVDLTGFTALAEERGDQSAAATALRLGDLAAELAPRHGGRVVKLLGDGVLARFPDVVSAVEASLELLRALPAAGLPTGHAGIHAGPLIARDGEVFGRTVNTAARIADATPDGHAYLTEELAPSLPPERFEAVPVGVVTLEGIGELRLVDIGRRNEPAG